MAFTLREELAIQIATYLLDTDVGTQKFQDALFALDRVCAMPGSIILDSPLKDYPIIRRPKPSAVEPEPSTAKTETKQSETVAQIALPTPTPEPLLDKERIREILSTAAEKGVLIQPLVARFVPEGKPIKLSEVPDKNYTALAKAVDEALAKSKEGAR